MLKRMCPRACLSASKYLLVVWLWISHIISRCLIIFIWKNGDINHTSEGCCEDLKRMMNIKYKKYTSHRISAQNITYHCYYYSLKASGINSLAFCLLYGPVLTTVRNHWEDHQFSSVAQSCQLFAIPWTEACQTSLSLSISWSLPKLDYGMASKKWISLRIKASFLKQPHCCCRTPLWDQNQEPWPARQVKINFFFPFRFYNLGH